MNKSGYSSSTTAKLPAFKHWFLLVKSKAGPWPFPKPLFPLREELLGLNPATVLVLPLTLHGSSRPRCLLLFNSSYRSLNSHSAMKAYWMTLNQYTPGP